MIRRRHLYELEEPHVDECGWFWWTRVGVTLRDLDPFQMHDNPLGIDADTWIEDDGTPLRSRLPVTCWQFCCWRARYAEDQYGMVRPSRDILKNARYGQHFRDDDLMLLWPEELWPDDPSKGLTAPSPPGVQI